VSIFATFDTQLAACLIVFAEGRLLKIGRPDPGQSQVQLTLEVDQGRAAEVRSQWDARTLEGNIWKFAAKRAELVKAVHATKVSRGR
jgi:hypothetical protein